MSGFLDWIINATGLSDLEFRQRPSDASGVTELEKGRAVWT